jgi:tRNA G10  N-methylase Trm11
MAATGKRPLEANDEFSVFDLFDVADMKGRLGGTLKIAEVLSTLELESGRAAIESVIEKHFSYLMRGVKGNKLLFAISFYGGSGDRESLEYKVKELGKADEMKVSVAHAKRGNLTHTEMVNKRLMDNGFEAMICMGRKQVYVAKTVDVHNPFEFRKRDMERPDQRAIFSMPPRLARIMINLSCARRGGKIIDPFCGIGTILQEAALMGYDIYGIDMKESVIGSARKNLRWLSKEYKVDIPDMENRIRKEDARWLSSHFGENSMDAIVTEPYMGPPMKRRPDRIRAMNILDDLKQLYEHSIREMLVVLKPGRRIVIVSPSFIVKGKFYGLNITEFAGRNGGKAIDPLSGSNLQRGVPIRDFEDRHNTIREIYVIEKISHRW